MIAARIRLLLLLRSRGGAALVALQLARAALPVLLALSVGDRVDALLQAHTAGRALAGGCLVAGLFLSDQLVWLVIGPVRALVVSLMREGHGDLPPLCVVLDDGRVAERGPHGQLMAAGATYAELYRLQERAYRDTSAP